ncbi:MAG: hypothetical protein KH050_13985, partial [Clostridiaceae bacterium]|nr:hypothetical protein [Clostridiaceae bacterium]
RRTKAIGAFPDGQSALMLVCARLRHVAATSWGVFFASTFSSKMQIDFLKVAWGISSVLHFPLRHSFRCRRGAVAGIQSLLVTDM